MPTLAPLASLKPMSSPAITLLVAVIFACALYANFSWAITNPVDYRFFPPFEPRVNANRSGNMRGEYYQMAEALVAGRGFADPFLQPTGPTAWQPPVYPLIMAGLLWAFDGSREVIMGVRVFLQVGVLIATGLMIMALAWRTTDRLRAGGALAIYLAALLWHFRTWFQATDDSWLVMLSLDVVIAGLCWMGPLSSWTRAGLWGLLGATCAMTNPIVGFAWGVLTVGSGVGSRRWSRLGVTMLCAGLAVEPWTIRNYLVFGRFIPLKSNLAFELYQSQCLQPEGLLSTFNMHPAGMQNQEGRDYATLGETAFLDRKWEQFRQSVVADPLDFADRVANRFMGATFWYAPLARDRPSRAWVAWLSRVVYAVPFVAMLFLLFTAIWRSLYGAQWLVIGVYALYLLPYIVISYHPGTYDAHLTVCRGLETSVQ